jgi:hypothetical protein
MKSQVSESRGKKINIGNDINYAQELADAIISICGSDELYNSYSLDAYNFGQKQIWNRRIKDFLSNLYE